MHMHPCLCTRGWLHRSVAVRCCCTIRMWPSAHSQHVPIAFLSRSSLCSSPLQSAPTPLDLSCLVYVYCLFCNRSMHMHPCLCTRGWLHRSAAVRCCCTIRMWPSAHSQHIPTAFYLARLYAPPRSNLLPRLSTSLVSLMCSVYFAIAACTCTRVCVSEAGYIAPPRFAAAALSECGHLHILSIFPLLLSRLSLCSSPLQSAPTPLDLSSFAYV